MLRLSDITGATVFAARSARGSTYTAIGKVHRTVFAPEGTRVVGFLVKRPDVAGMVRRSEVFVALDCIAPCDGGIVITKYDEGVDDAARARLNIDGSSWDECILWAGMDAITEDGHELGYVSDVSFNAHTGVVQCFYIGDGSIAQHLVGTIEVAPTLLRGYRDGYMVVAQEAAKSSLSGGLAGRAGAAVGKAQVEGGKAVAKASAVADKAADRGSRALGKQLGKAKGMFGAFVDEYRKASS